MKKSYSSPRLVVHGRVDAVTGVFGNPGTGDVFLVDGTIVEEGELSRDICVTDDGSTCA